jgi:hypothetical protein
MAAQADEYRAKAAECARQAQQASNSTMKEVYQDVARMWLHLAEHAETRPDSIPSGRQPPTPTRHHQGHAVKRLAGTCKGGNKMIQKGLAFRWQQSGSVARLDEAHGLLRSCPDGIIASAGLRR